MSTVWAGLPTLPVSEGRLAASASDDEDGECEQDDGGKQVAGGLDSRASNELTRELLGWEPTHPTLIPDLQEGPYS